MGKPIKAEWIQTDVAILGGGVSGLAAAGALRRKGLDVLVIEASDRLGGRILSHEMKRGRGSIELGAEFIHGGGRELQKLVRQSGLVAREAAARVWTKREGKWVSARDYWDRIGRVVDSVSSIHAGVSFAEALRRRGKRIPEEDRKWAKGYVSGFEAAPVSEISARALGWDRAGTESTNYIFDGPYHRVVETLHSALRTPGRSFGRADLRLGLRATAIAWKSGQVTVSCERSQGKAPVRIAAKAAVITLPLGVLQKKALRFEPRIKQKENVIARMGWGQVVRIVLRFRTGFWSAPFMPAQLGSRHGRHFGFVNSREQPIPVWWALRSPEPILTGWAGGDAALRLLGHSKLALKRITLRSLAEIFETKPAELKRWLLEVHYHDWSRDPFTWGAYSFPAAGCEDGGERLAEPVQETLFFAGEATAPEYGTVHGALESGHRAAREVEQALA